VLHNEINTENDATKIWIQGVNQTLCVIWQFENTHLFILPVGVALNPPESCPLLREEDIPILGQSSKSCSVPAI
jgi:hypothetical protein